MITNVKPMRLIVTPKVRAGLDPVSEVASNIFVDRLRMTPALVAGVGTGSTLERAEAHLARKILTYGVDFSGLHTVGLDEYLGEQKQFTYTDIIRRTFCDPLEMSADRTHFHDWQTIDPLLSCQQYEAMIKEIGGIGVQFLGLGLNGHIGFNEPLTPFDSETHVIDLAQTTCISNSRFRMEAQDLDFLGLKENEDPTEKMKFWNADQKQYFFENVMPRVSTQSMTMGIGTILKAGEILILINGSLKAPAARFCLFEEPNIRFPGSALRFHDNVTAIVDEPAAMLFPYPYNQIGHHIIR